MFVYAGTVTWNQRLWQIGLILAVLIALMWDCERRVILPSDPARWFERTDELRLLDEELFSRDQFEYKVVLKSDGSWRVDMRDPRGRGSLMLDPLQPRGVWRQEGEAIILELTERSAPILNRLEGARIEVERGRWLVTTPSGTVYRPLIAVR